MFGKKKVGEINKTAAAAAAAAEAANTPEQLSHQKKTPETISVSEMTWGNDNDQSLLSSFFFCISTSVNKVQKFDGSSNVKIFLRKKKKNVLPIE